MQTRISPTARGLTYAWKAISRLNDGGCEMMTDILIFVP